MLLDPFYTAMLGEPTPYSLLLTPYSIVVLSIFTTLSKNIRALMNLAYVNVSEMTVLFHAHALRFSAETLRQLFDVTL